MRKSTILIQSTTRENLKQLGTKGQTYDQLINQLIVKTRSKDSVDRRFERTQSNESNIIQELNPL
jgi:hypothetical protein